ncbi:pseudouridine synthase [Aliterella atlantica]|uniref:Pseudouridine synthase n=1 Tax=Aliterella atlantica CENA595 TaxID=1618023 RepID=A0A0D8ZLW5_9CYAN|nr:pseudouridine synthase [Aliterella atlantica]KJH69715.1 pseudouridine synthase [Aliterella atlantica CENA595]
MEERIQKILSQWGVASRRHAEELILAGRVQRNGVVVGLGEKADVEKDAIAVDGKLIRPVARPQLVYILLNKPKGIVATCNDPQGRKTVIDLLPKNLQIGQGIHPVGRLDVDSTGALILTNDGELTHKLTHPRHSIPKTYQVWVQGNPPPSVLKQWRDGIILDGKRTRKAQVKVVKRLDSQTCLEVILKEGRNRQIRRVTEQLGYPVVNLHRTAIGAIQLQPLAEAGLLKGCYRYLKDFEICFLQSQASIASVEEPGAVQECSPK